MSSSYKPKLIELFFQERDDDVPELIQLNQSTNYPMNKDLKKQIKPKLTQ